MILGPAPETHPDNKNVEVNMIRDDFRDIPQFPLPDGYHFRPYQSGDEAIWTRLQQAAEPFFTVEDDLFTRQYAAMADALHERMVFVETEDCLAVASISAWWETNRDNPNDRGRIHWVVVHPDHQQRGLTKPMMTWAMHALAQHHDSAMLGTSTGRIWAIKVYLDFGFYPDPTEIAEKPEVAEGWRVVHAQLSHPLLAKTIST